MTQNPSLATALAEAFDARLLDLHVSIPGQVTAYDAGSQKIAAQPMLRRAFLDESGARQTEAMPIVADVPVMFPGSGPANGMTFPVAVGDTVALLFSESSIAHWLATGALADSGDDRMHSLSDAMAIPGLNSFAKSLSGVSTTAVVVRAATEVRLGDAAAVDSAVRGTTYRSAEDTLFTALSAFAAVISAYAAAIKAVADPSNAATPALLTGATTMITAISAFQAVAPTYLARKVKVF